MGGGSSESRDGCSSLLLYRWMGRSGDEMPTLDWCDDEKRGAQWQGLLLLMAAPRPPSSLGKGRVRSGVTWTAFPCP